MSAKVWSERLERDPVKLMGRMTPLVPSLKNGFKTLSKVDLMPVVVWESFDD
jgi:hypothetical protein